MKEMMKNISLLILIVMLSGLGIGCSGGETPDSSTNNTDTVTASNESDNEVIIRIIMKEALVNPKVYSQTEGFIHYSLDYPSNYFFDDTYIWDDSIHSDFTTDNVSNYVYGIDSVSGVDYHASNIYLSVYKIGSSGYHTVQDIHENFHMMVYETWENEIIEDTEWECGNITGYKFVYLDWYGPTMLSIPEAPGMSLEEILEPIGFVRVVEEYIVFEFHDHFWWFSFSTPVESYEKQDELLEQVVKSLTILD